MSPDEASAIEGGGTSLKYTFISVFGFNMMIKLLLKSSMNYLWSLVHALQVFNYLLYINLKYPANIDAFAGYLSIATGDVEEIK